MPVLGLFSGHGFVLIALKRCAPLNAKVMASFLRLRVTNFEAICDGFNQSSPFPNQPTELKDMVTQYEESFYSFDPVYEDWMGLAYINVYERLICSEMYMRD